MDTRDTCPDPSRLRALLGGALSGAEEAALTGHLDGCPTCCALLDRWSDPSGVLMGLAPDGGPPQESSPALDRILNELKGRTPRVDPAQTTDVAGGPRTVRAGAEDDDREEMMPGWLAPTGQPGSLGRIGPYEVTGLVGQGGMGVVLKALDTGLNRVVAVKVLAPALTTSPRARRRFLREARAAAAVCHENVVTIHAVDEADGRPYLVMQYVKGPSLQEKIDSHGPLGLKGILRIGMQVSSGLAAAHAQGLVHRDVKPANILLENGVERVKITDFGLARSATDARMTQSGAVAGTPKYMAPEQARGEPVDHRTDLFSLGGLLYAMATGEPPFDGDSAVAVLRRVSDDPHRPVRSLNPEVPDWLAAVIDRLLAKDPAARFQSADEVAELLGRRLAQLQLPGGSEPEIVKPPPPARPSGRRRWTGLIAGALAIAACAAVVLLLVRPRHPSGGPEVAFPQDPSAGRATAPAPAPVGPSADALVLGLAANRERQYADAIKFLDEALRRNPRSTTALLARGDAFKALKDSSRALADYEAVLHIDPRSAVGYFARAGVLTQTKEFDRAVADCDEALRLDPALTWSYFARGLANNGRKAWDRAIVDFDGFIGQVPDFAPSYLQRAIAYENRGDLSRAVADVDTALRLKPTDQGFRHYRAWIRTRLGDYDGGIADYSQLIRDNPNAADKRSDRACAFALAGRYAEAEADFEAALRGFEKYPWPLVRRAHILYFRRGDYDRAIADCDRMLQVDPKLAEAYLYRGLALRAKGENARAVQDFDQALALDQPDAVTFQGRLFLRYPELYDARADARARLGDTAGAEADHRAAKKLRSQGARQLAPSPPED